MTRNVQITTRQIMQVMGQAGQRVLAGLPVRNDFVLNRAIDASWCSRCTFRLARPCGLESSKISENPSFETGENIMKKQYCTGTGFLHIMIVQLIQL